MFIRKMCVAAVAAIISLLVVSAQASYGAETARNRPPVDVSNVWAQDKHMRKVIAEVFGKHGSFVVYQAERIAGCESSGNPSGPIVHWEPDGSGLLRNKPINENVEPTSAAGSFQILLKLHRKWLARKGFTDMRGDEVQYVKAAEQLFVENGHDFDDWSESSGCSKVRTANK